MQSLFRPMFSRFDYIAAFVFILIFNVIDPQTAGEWTVTAISFFVYVLLAGAVSNAGEHKYVKEQSE